jgi:hypothetical protein
MEVEVNQGAENMRHSGLTYVGGSQSSENDGVKFILQRLFIENVINIVYSLLN